MNQLVRVLLINIAVVAILAGISALLVTFTTYGQTGYNIITILLGAILIYVIGAVGTSIYLARKGDSIKARAVFLSLLFVLLIGFSFCSLMAG